MNEGNFSKKFKNLKILKLTLIILWYSYLFFISSLYDK